MKSKKARWVVVLVAVAIGTSIAFSAPLKGDRNRNRKRFRAIAAAALTKAIKEGKALFHDKSLSTNGRYCAKCHENPKRPHLNLAYRVNDYPKWDRHARKVITLGQKVDQMFVHMFKAKPLPLGSEKLVAIQAYLMSISRDRNKKR